MAHFDAKSDAVAQTEQHAAEVAARVEGRDGIEYPYATLGRGPAPLVTDLPPGHDWESLRPLEVKPMAPPVVPYPTRWYEQRGRFVRLQGLGRLFLLRARKPY